MPFGFAGVGAANLLSVSKYIADGSTPSLYILGVLDEIIPDSGATGLACVTDAGCVSDTADSLAVKRRVALDEGEEGQAAVAAGDYRWAATLLNHLVFAEPSNAQAKALLAFFDEKAAHAPSFKAAHILYYLGGAIAPAGDVDGVASDLFRIGRPPRPRRSTSSTEKLEPGTKSDMHHSRCTAKPQGRTSHRRATPPHAGPPLFMRLNRVIP